MLFSSLEFIFIFFPISLVIYYLLPRSARVAFLLLTSLFFYAWSGLRELPVMLAMILINYASGLIISRAVTSSLKLARAVLALSIAFDLGTLFFFKYSGFAFETVLSLLPGAYLPRIIPPLPIGISFYTFQAISYLVDVYRRECEAQRNAIKFATYISLYPQLIAGPIVRYPDVADTLDEKRNVFAFGDGFERFIFGLSKKMLLANTAGEIWSTVADGERTAISAWLGIVCFSFQIYFDFSGYSDMAIGLGKIYGFEFPENFNYPYTCRSVSDFWRRWHITLSSFFKNYLYIPLGGNRRGRARMFFNMFIVWSLTGLWHGASLNFIFWGIYYFVFLSFEKTKLGQKVHSYLPGFIYRILTLSCILGGWLIFACDKPGQLGEYLRDMFSSPFFDRSSVYDILRLLPFLAISVLFSTPLPAKLFGRLKNSMPIIAASVSCLLFMLSIAYLVNSSYNPFLYFRF